MNEPILFSLIKNFFVLFCSIRTFKYLLNIPFTCKTHFSVFLFSLFTTPIVCYVWSRFPLYTILTTTLFVTAFCYHSFQQNLPKTLLISSLSIGGSYALFAPTAIIVLPIGYLLLLCDLPRNLITLFLLLIIGVVQNILLFLIFRTRRLRKGIPNISNVLLGDTGIFISAVLILFTSVFFVTRNTRNSTFHLLLISFILALGIIIWLWWQKNIHTDYICQSHTRRIDILEDTLREKEAEIERLSKIIHKDNKLLAALEHSARELLSDTPGDTAERLLQELNRLSEERRDTLHAYEAKQLPLAETGLFSIDTMLRYLQQRAQKYAIDFQVHFDENISSVTNVINEQDLCTIVADLGENAIIATKSAEIKNILLSIEKKDSINYTLNFFDSGEPFPEEVLAQLGKKRYTTHAATGGSGIGLMTTSELAQKYHAEFSISSTDQTPPYTKCISLTFPDTQQES